MSQRPSRYVSRAGHKLEAALHTFAFDPRGRVCLDIGSHVGGFVDCLLQHGAARVHAVDPGYGVLDYRLRNDPRVVVHERTNAMRFQCPERCDLVTIDAGWTPQRLILPAAARALAVDGRVITLVKPQYEAPKDWLRRGVLPEERLEAAFELVERDVIDEGWRILAPMRSPLAGHGGNAEFLWLLARGAAPNSERAEHGADGAGVEPDQP